MHFLGEVESLLLLFRWDYVADVPTLEMGGFPFVEGSRLFTASLSGYVILCISECIYVMQMYQEAT